MEPMGDCIYDPVAVICLYKAMGVVWNNRDPEYDEWNNLDYHDFVQMGGNVGYEEQEVPRAQGTPPTGGRPRSTPDGPDFPQYAAKFQEEGWFDCRKWHPERWGTYRRWEMGYRRQQGGYNLYAAIDEKCGFMTPTAKVEVWSTIAETYIPDGAATFASTNHGRSEHPRHRQVPHWVEPKNSARIEP